MCIRDRCWRCLESQHKVTIVICMQRYYDELKPCFPRSSWALRGIFRHYCRQSKTVDFLNRNSQKQNVDCAIIQSNSAWTCLAAWHKRAPNFFVETDPIPAHFALSTTKNSSELNNGCAARRTRPSANGALLAVLTTLLTSATFRHLI